MIVCNFCVIDDDIDHVDEADDIQLNADCDDQAVFGPAVAQVSRKHRRKTVEISQLFAKLF